MEKKIKGTVINTCHTIKGHEDEWGDFGAAQLLRMYDNKMLFFSRRYCNAIIWRLSAAIFRIDIIGKILRLLWLALVTIHVESSRVVWVRGGTNAIFEPKSAYIDRFTFYDTKTKSDGEKPIKNLSPSLSVIIVVVAVKILTRVDIAREDWMEIIEMWEL